MGTSSSHLPQDLINYDSTPSPPNRTSHDVSTRTQGINPPSRHRQTRPTTAESQAPPPYTVRSQKISAPSPLSPSHKPPIKALDVNTTNQSHRISRRNTASSQGKEDPLRTLARYNTIFIIDDSLSMAGTLWRQARTALIELADMAAQHDTDGLDVYFVNSSKEGNHLKNAREVKALFERVRPIGDVTLIGTKLEELLLPYLAKIEAAKKSGPEELKKIKPVNYIIITDGVPTDTPEETIRVAAERLDRGHFPLSQIGIQFVQVGNSQEATEYLEEMDDQLSKEYKIRDMVDTTAFGDNLRGDTLVKILLGGINRRIDKRGV